MENVKLIIVEDEPAILRGIELLIGQIDLPIEIVGTYLKGQDALDEFEKVSPDIVLTDVQMPVITGLELIQEMKTRGYSAEYLILSSYAEFQYVQQAIKLDVRNYLLKPRSTFPDSFFIDMDLVFINPTKNKTSHITISDCQ